MTEFINQMEPTFDEKEREALNDYMLSGSWVTEFKKTREFEQEIAGYTGAVYCSVVSNGTVSLAIALMACGIGAGDEVLVPDYTMAATPDAVALTGAKIVFVDVERKSLCMDYEKMKAAVTEKTRAVMLVSINGRYPSDIERIVEFCEEKGIVLIEDSAQSLGSFYKGKHVGRYGKIGSFSFSAPKIITTGQGGALITDDKALFDKIKLIRDFGRASGGSDHYLTKGWNFKFTDLQAVVGLEQMKKLPQRVIRKKELGKLYERELHGISEVELIDTDLENTPPWFFDILCERRDDLMGYLKEKGIGGRPFYPALHKEPAFLCEGNFPNAEYVADHGLWLPSAVSLSDETVVHICDVIKEFYG